MSGLLEVGLINAAMATGLAIVVWLATRIWRHPVLVHTLWIVVLLKLITPPLVSVPWRLIETSVASQSSTGTSRDAAELIASQTSPITAGNIEELSSIEEESVTFAPIEATGNEFTEPHGRAPLAPQQDDTGSEPAPIQEWSWAVFPITWKTAAIAIWLSGTVVYVFLSGVRLARFHRALSHTLPAPVEVQHIAAEVAAQCGVTIRYQLRVTEGQLSPLVWPIGRPTILMPRRLLAELSPDEVETLLAHEFAHLCRRDHWLRWLELAVTAAYWWHPVVWWAKAAIGRAEEKACDAWVVSGFPDASARYASALFKAIQFASADRQAAPAMASALGGQDLKERIEHIMNATWNPQLFLPIRLSVLAVATLILPLSLRAVGEEATATQAVGAETETTEDETTATNEDIATTTEDAIDQISETADSTVAESADASTTEVLDAVIGGAESPAATTTDNPFAVQPTAEARPDMQPRRVPVPADPYHIAPGDVLFVAAVAGSSVPVIEKDIVVEPSGSVALGPQFGRVKIGGLLLEDAEKAVAAHLKQSLRDPMVQITIGGWRNVVRKSRPRPVDSNGNPQTAPPGMRFPWEGPESPPGAATTAEAKPSLGNASPDELAALQEHVKFLEEHFRRKDALFRVAARGGSADARDIAAYELATARARLALAEGKREEAIRLLVEAQKLAEQAMISVTAANQANMTTDSAVLQAARNLSDSKRRLIEVQQATAPTAGTSAAEPDERRNTVTQLSISTPAPAVSESIGVLKKIVQRAEQDYQRAQQLAQNNAASTTEVARAQSEYEISVERLKQGERALRFYRAQVEMAEAEYQVLAEANKRAPGAVTALELRRKAFEVEMARAKLEELAE